MVGRVVLSMGVDVLTFLYQRNEQIQNRLLQDIKYLQMVKLPPDVFTDATPASPSFGETGRCSDTERGLFYAGCNPLTIADPNSAERRVKKGITMTDFNE